MSEKPMLVVRENETPVCPKCKTKMHENTILDAQGKLVLAISGYSDDNEAVYTANCISHGRYLYKIESNLKTNAPSNSAPHIPEGVISNMSHIADSFQEQEGVLIAVTGRDGRERVDYMYGIVKENEDGEPEFRALALVFKETSFKMKLSDIMRENTEINIGPDIDKSKLN